jgi:hypothetical protein
MSIDTQYDWMWMNWNRERASERGLEWHWISDSGARGTKMLQRFHSADGPESSSVRHLVCCGTLLSGLFRRLTRLRVCVSHGLTFVSKTTVGGARGAKGAAVRGRRMAGTVRK